MAANEALRDYLRSRDVVTREELVHPAEALDRPMFVIQKREVTTIYYDFRLEIDDVLKSWSLPTAPSTNPAAKRMAMPIEDFPLDYATFEGVNPEDQYGGGATIVWDAGSYRNLQAENEDENRTMDACVEQGKIEVWLEGQKLRGGYALMRTGEGEAWVLRKLQDEHADPEREPAEEQPESVLSELTLEELWPRATREGAGTELDRGNVGSGGSRRLGDRGEEGTEGTMPIGNRPDR